jgi:hypothetical protein
MNARETADRHGRYVTEGNMRGVVADFTPEAMAAFQTFGKMPPKGTNSYEVVAESQDGDAHVYEIRYSNGSEALTIRSRWQQVGDDWMIVQAEPVG